MSISPVLGSVRSMAGPLGQGKATGGATPYSLYFDGATAYVGCGTHASIMGLNAGDFTVDAYWQYLATKTSGAIVGQYNGWPDFQGWVLQHRAQYNRYEPKIESGGSILGVGTPADGNWHYARLRLSGTTMYMQVAGGGTLTDTVGVPDISAEPLEIANSVGSHGLLAGRICYVHIWNNDQGAIGAVPTSPFAVDANTVARYTFSEGSGLVLGDDVGNSNGTIINATWSSTVPAGWSL